MDQYIGRLLDNRYEILEVIGTGGMAVVYKARCHRLNRLVAIKILKDEYSRDEEFRRRFHAEGEAVAMLSHPNIVQVYDVSSSDNANFIVMELIDGISLKQYMEKKGVLNWKETLHFAMQIAKGLEHAHSRGIVHRDIKPHNVMVLKNGSVKVMDFGIARVMSKSNTLTKEALGSVHYISPEQAKGAHTDNRSDIYSLSVVMYEMMTGRPPYDGESPVAVAIQHINGGAAMPSTLNPNIPGGLEQIIMKGMSLEIQNRYISATQMLQDMEEFRKNPGILFDYKTVVDSATRPITVITQQPRTTAERVVQQKTGVRPTHTGNTGRVNVSGGTGAVRKRTTGTVSTTQKSQRPYDMSETARRNNQRRREEERQRAEEERSRVATVAIVVCSAVAILAIVVFLVALFNGALLNREMEYVEVPSLVGETYSDSLVYSLDDFKIHLLPQQYDDTYEEGQIMHQEPLGGSEVKKGADLWLTISMGPEPVVKVMSNFLGSDGNVAKSILEGQGFVVIPKTEPSDEVKEGLVVRTDPEAGTELAEGQDVYIYISSGPDVTTALMLHVVGKDKDHALELLDAKGFKSVRTVTVDSDEPAGTVVYQSEEAGLEIDILTEIILEISAGPKETEPEETEPVEEESRPQETTEPTLPAVRRNVTFDLPQKDVGYTLSIHQDGVQVISGIPIAPGTDSFAAEFSGAGTVTFDLYVDGVYHSSVTLEFVDG